MWIQKQFYVAVLFIQSVYVSTIGLSDTTTVRIVSMQPSLIYILTLVLLRHFQQHVLRRGGCCNPPWIFYIKCPILLCLLPMYSYGSVLSIDTKTKKYHPSSYDVTMTSSRKRALEILKIFTTTENIHKE